MNVLNVTEKVKSNNSIVSYEYRSHQPFGSATFDNNDEIRIAIPEIDNYTIPGESYLYIEGGIKTRTPKGLDVNKTAKLINNPAAFMFSDIRYLMNGVQVDSVRNVGITSTIKGYFSFNQSEMSKLENAGWNVKENTAKVVDENGKFAISVPLRTLLGFAEDFKKIVLNVRQELILIRNNDDLDIVVAAAEESVVVQIDKIIWRVPHISVGLREQLSLTKLTERNVDIQVPFRSWEIHEYPSLPQTTKQMWAVKTAPQLETPRFILIGFQTGKKGKAAENMSKFNNIKLTNLTVFLNGERFPYDNLNIDFDNNQYAVLYDMYSRFQNSYYLQEGEPIFTPEQFKATAPLVGIDCTYQPDALHKSGVEIKIEFTTKEAIPAETTAYCLILHDKAFQYSPLTKIVKELM